MSDLFHDSSFWVLIAFIVFILIVFLKASSAISKSLEQRGSYIQNKIGESEKTLLEAQNLLKESQNSLKKYKNDSENIILKEREEAIKKAQNYLQKLDKDLKRKEIVLNKEINYLENTAKEAIQEEILKITLNCIENIISDPKYFQQRETQFSDFLDKIPLTITNSSLKQS